MSIETDLQTLLASHAPLATLVAGRIAQNADPGGTYPLVVYTVRQDYERALDGAVLGHTATVQVQAWAKTAAQADAVADAIEAACATAPSTADVTVLDRAGVFDPDLQLDGTQLTIEWAVH